MFDLALRAVEASRSSKPIWGEVDKSTWREVDRYIATLLQKPGPPSLHRFIALTAHYRRWRYQAEDEIAAIRWATAVLEVRYTEETCRSAVDTALQIVHIERLRPHIPVEVWAWLKKQPILPPHSEGRSRGTNPDVICHVRGLGDLEILKSYFVLLWSEWTSPSDDEIDAMEHSIRTDFCGTRMEHHRKDFVRRLDHILGELDRGLEYFRQYTTCYSAQDDIQVAKGRYGQLKGVLLEVEREAAMTALTRYHSTCALPLPCP
ncbi:hypothetical protein BJ322DRAFT_293901 [Thelephora terrestris]|uniref:Uncharacterized protein n=1 Tax=Thelephora terrestris TaxID=56493 RepID=A0A9P6H6Z8_9AGAM|nr:hypothetical protein BJ322DRAFT_293901 [Thelephora terrestris]